MSKENLNAFNEKAKGDEDLQTRIQYAWLELENGCQEPRRKYAETLVAMGKEAGFEFSANDVAEHLIDETGGELSEGDLDEVAGGGGMTLSASYKTFNMGSRLNRNTMNLRGLDLKRMQHLNKANHGPGTLGLT